MSVSQQNLEFEARFVDIDQEALSLKLRTIGARDLGEDFLKELIFYDRAGEWEKMADRGGKFVRLRKSRDGVFLTFKHWRSATLGDVVEIETKVQDFDESVRILEEIGLFIKREQEKKRYTFIYNDVLFDFDTWPTAPTYLEIEGSSEEEVRQAAALLSLRWEDALFISAKGVLEKKFGIPISGIKTFTFEKIEYT